MIRTRRAVRHGQVATIARRLRGAGAFAAAVLAALLPALSQPALAAEWPSKPTSWLSDYAKLLPEADRKEIDRKLQDYEARTGNQIFVAIFPSLENEDRDDLTARLFKAWEVGAKGKDRGVLLTVFVQDRKMRIEVGYGAEADLTDAISSRIIRDQLTPAFREQRFADGIRSAIDSIVTVLEGGKLPPAPKRARRGSKRPPVGVIILIVFIAVGVLSRILQSAARAPATISRRRAAQRLPWWWWMGGGGGGFGGGTFGGGWGGGGGGWGGGGGGFSGGGGGASGGGGAGGSW